MNDVVCPTCKDEPCDRCNGTGRQIEHHDFGATEVLACGWCFGEPCPVCAPPGYLGPHDRYEADNGVIDLGLPAFEEESLRLASIVEEPLNLLTRHQISGYTDPMTEIEFNTEVADDAPVWWAVNLNNNQYNKVVKATDPADAIAIANNWWWDNATQRQKNRGLYDVRVNRARFGEVAGTGALSEIKDPS